MIDTAPQSTPPLEALNNGVVAWLKERTGHGPEHCHTSIRGDHVIVVLRGVQTRMERTLVDAGEPERVRQLQRTLCDDDRDILSTLVSSTIGRPVQTTLGDHDPASDTSALVFLFECAG